MRTRRATEAEYAAYSALRVRSPNAQAVHRLAREFYANKHIIDDMKGAT